MPPYIRRFRGWDWVTPRVIQHLPWREQERLTEEAWRTVRCHRRYRVLRWLWVSLSLLAGGFAVLAGVLLFRGLLLLTTFLIIFMLAPLVQMVATGSLAVWQSRLFRAALRQELLVAGIRPGICFECGYNLEGYEGAECPACDVPLLRPADSPS